MKNRKQFSVVSHVIAVIAAVVASVSVFLSIGGISGVDWFGGSYSTNMDSLMSDANRPLGITVLVVSVVSAALALITICTKSKATNLAAGIVRIVGGLAMAGIATITILAVPGYTNLLGQSANVSVAPILLAICAVVTFITGIMAVSQNGNNNNK